MAGYYSPRMFTNGLVIYLDSGNRKSYSGSGTSWIDLSGNSNNGSLVNGVGYTNSNLGYLSFDGVDDLVSLSSPSGYLTNFGTLTFWIYPNLASSKTFFQQYSNDLNRMSLTHDTSTVTVYSGYSTTFLSFATATNSVPSGKWSHIGYTFDFTNNSFSLYVNGSLSNSVIDTDVPDIGAAGEITLGCAKDFDVPSPYYYNFYDGRISIFSYYNILLSSDQIMNNYNNTKGRFGL